MTEERFQKIMAAGDFDPNEQRMLHRYFVDHREKLPDGQQDWQAVWDQAIVKFNRALRRVR